jgi:hypothetical protein
MKKVIDVRPLDDYRIWLKFDDGTQGEVDLVDLAGRGVLEAWTDRRVFEEVRVDESGAVVWPDEIDLCPDDLYPQTSGSRSTQRRPARPNCPLSETPAIVSSPELSDFQSIVYKLRSSWHRV